MRGYCYSCKRENNGEKDEYGVAVCADCGDDLNVGFHVIEAHVVDSEPEEEYYEYPQFYDGPY